MSLNLVCNARIGSNYLCASCVVFDQSVFRILSQHNGSNARLCMIMSTQPESVTRETKVE